MNLQQYHAVTQMEVFGQFVGMLTVTDQEKNVLPQFKYNGILKVSSFIIHPRKDRYIDLLNKSTKVQEGTVAEFKAKRPSYYESEGMNGFCCHLKSNPTQKYFEFRWTEKDAPVEKTLYVDRNGVLYAPGAILKDKTKNDRAQAADECRVQVRQFKLSSIALMSINGKRFLDPDLEKYTKFDEIIADFVASAL